MGVFGAWLRNVCSPYEATDRKTAEAAATLHVILLGGLAVSFGFMVTAPWLHPNPSLVVPNFAAMLLSHALGLWLAKRGHVRPVAIAMSFFMFAFITVTAYRFGGLSGIGVFVYPTVVIFAGLTWSGSAALGFAVAASLAALVMGYLDPESLHRSLTLPSPLRVWVCMTAIVSIISLMLMVALRSMRQAEERERALNDQLQEAQRLEALGRLAGGVAHDFNNLLTVMLLHTSMLKIERPDQADGLVPIEHAALRAAEMTQQMLALGRRQTLLAKVVDVNATLRDTIQLVRTLLPPSVTLHVKYGELAGRTKIDPAGLERIVINLVINARDAMKDGGEITLSTDAVTLGAAEARVFQLPAGHYTQLVVSDTGPGISASILPRLFEPFATTKSKGTGLGLASVRGLVTQSGGCVRVLSETGKGARFEVFLPLSEASAHERIASTRTPPPAAIRVLLLDEDVSVRAVTRAMLESAGYAVRESDAPVHGLDADLRETDLLVTDQLDHDAASFDQVRARHPKLRVAVVRKPFTRDQLLDTLQRTLNAA